MTRVSVITPVHNAEAWLQAALTSASKQKFNGELELSIYDDASCDSSAAILSTLSKRLPENVRLVVSGHAGRARGCGFAKNRAIEQSSGTFLCFLDADDEMMEGRIEQQLSIASQHPDCIVGCRFHRFPADSTRRFTNWANQLPLSLLTVQVFMSHGPTIVMPTWFMHRSVFDKVGHFKEIESGFPEDLDFFYRHLDAGGGVKRVDADLMMYRFHSHATTFTVREDTIYRIRLHRLVSLVLGTWSRFSIWNAGRQGRRFFRSLPEAEQKKVEVFCDVDERKLRLGRYTFEESNESPKPTVPIVHFSLVQPPVIVCAKPGMTNGELEANVESLGLIEGKDFYWFS